MNRFYPAQSSTKSSTRYQAHAAVSDLSSQELPPLPSPPELPTEARAFGVSVDDPSSYEDSDGYDSDANFYEA